MIKSFESDCQYIINSAHNFAVKNPDFTGSLWFLLKRFIDKLWWVIGYKP
jgi:hypothetical protein